MSAVIKAAKLIFRHRRELKEAYDKNGLDYKAHGVDMAEAGVDIGQQAATAELAGCELVPRFIVRGLQFVLALVIVGIYGKRVGAGQQNAADADAAWWFGMIVAVISCVSALSFAIIAPFGAVSKRFKVHYWFAWDLGLVFLWIIVFGVFMKIFHNRDDDDSYKGSSTPTEKTAAWLDLVNCILWLISGVYGGIKTAIARRRDKIRIRFKNEFSNAVFTRGRSNGKGNDQGSSLYAQSHVSEPAPAYSRGHGDEEELSYYTSSRRSSRGAPAEYPQQAYYGI